MSSPNPSSPRRLLALVVVLVVGLAAGFLLARRTAVPASAAGLAELGELDVQPPGRDREGNDATAGTVPADSATAAVASELVTTFLDAEVAGHFETSWGLLTSQDREELGPLAAWRNLHADHPTVTGFEGLQVRNRDGTVEVVTELELASTLDEFIGFVPARATATWVLAHEDDGWRVSFTDSSLRPRYPDPEGAPEAALAWARAQRDCEDVPSTYAGPVYGVPALAEDLCGQDAEIGVGDVADLDDDASSEPLVTAFGPSVFGWARVVPITGPVPLRVVLAPIGDEWTVVGVLRDL